MDHENQGKAAGIASPLFSTRKRPIESRGERKKDEKYLRLTGSLTKYPSENCLFVSPE
jgi:hypothetical protein